MRIALILALCIALLSGCASYGTVTEANWDLRLPDGYTELYSADSGASFHGDGFRYHVFQFEKTDAVSDLVVWSTEDSPLYAKWTTEWSETWGVPVSMDEGLSQYPSWSKVKSDNSRLILFWNEEDGHLYVVENLI